MTFYQLVLLLCEDKGITLEELAKDIGIRVSNVRQWKKLKTRPKFDTVVKLCHYFRVPMYYFDDAKCG